MQKVGFQEDLIQIVLGSLKLDCWRIDVTRQMLDGKPCII